MNAVSRLGVIVEQGIKGPVRVETTVQLLRQGHPTVNGVVLNTGDRVLVKDQTDPIENGIFTVQGSGVDPWTRAPDFNKADDIIAAIWITSQETETLYLIDVPPGTYWNPDATAINFTEFTAGASTLGGLDDLDLTGLGDGDVIAYNLATGNWEPSGRTAVWGTLGGTLSDQTDLQTELDLLAPIASPTFTGTVNVTGDLTLDSPLAVAEGGTGFALYNTGALLRSTGTTTMGTIERGTTPWGKLLQLVSGVPDWQFPSHVLFTERADHFQTPAAGFGELWARSSDGAAMWTNRSGVDFNLTDTGAPGAPTDSVQYNDGGAFTGSAEFTYEDNFLAPLITFGTGGAVKSPNFVLNGGTGGNAQITWEQNFTERGKFSFVPSAAGFTNIIRLMSQAGPFEIGSSATINLRVQNGIGLEIVGGSGMGIRMQDNVAADYADVAGFGQFYIKESDNFPYYRSAAGVEYNMTDSGSPGGANTQIQYNNAGAFGADANLTWDGTWLNVTNLAVNGTEIDVGSWVLDIDQVVGAGQDDFVLTYDNASGEISLEEGGGGSAAESFLLMGG